MSDPVPHQQDGRRKRGGHSPALGKSDPRLRRRVSEGPTQEAQRQGVGRDSQGKLKARLDPRSALQTTPEGELTLDKSKLGGTSLSQSFNPTIVGGGGGGGGGGSTGPAGPPGPPGTDGLDGGPGPRGKPGDEGERGRPGAPGVDGQAGSQGIQGVQGYLGPRGREGEDGRRGFPGTKGDKGDTGAQGPPGSGSGDGSMGARGRNGDEGERGPRGFPGERGLAGATGATGAAGSPGQLLALRRTEEGERGPRGFPGERGPAGAVGQAVMIRRVESVDAPPRRNPAVDDGINLTRVTGRFRFQGIITPTTLSSDQNDYSPTGLNGAVIVRLSASTSVRTITGLDSSWASPGQQVILCNVDTVDIKLSHESASSSAANRFNFPTGVDATIRGGAVANRLGDALWLRYDGVLSRWGVVTQFLPALHATSHTNGVDDIAIAVGASGVLSGNKGLVPAPVVGDQAKLLRPIRSGPGSTIIWDTYSNGLDAAISSTADVVLARGASAWDATATIAADTSETARALVQGNDRRLLHDLYKKRQMQLLPRFNSTTIDTVGMAAPTVAGSGVTQAILGNDYSVLRFLANAGTGSDSYMLDTAGICRIGFESEHVWVIQIGNVITSYRVWWGLTTANLSAVGAPTTQSVAAFRYDTGVDTASVQFRAVTCDGASGVTTTATGVTVTATQAYRFVIITSSSDVKFYIDGTLVATHTTNLPAANTNLGHQVVVRTLDASNKRVEWSRSAHMNQ